MSSLVRIAENKPGTHYLDYLINCFHEGIVIGNGSTDVCEKYKSEVFKVISDITPEELIKRCHEQREMQFLDIFSLKSVDLSKIIERCLERRKILNKNEEIKQNLDCSIPPSLSYPLTSSKELTIRVVDNNKNNKKDFQCPYNLLLQEIPYFKTYKNLDPNVNEINITIHCDIIVFDWLMSYVKHCNNPKLEQPKIDPRNCISIYISAEYLKMDSLVKKVLDFCHSNMDVVLTMSTSLSCLEKRLYDQLLARFHHNDIDTLVDKKNKIKSKLYINLIEHLFDLEAHPERGSPESAASLYQCFICRRLLTQKSQTKIKCLPSRLAIDLHGNLVSLHQRNPSWNVNEYISNLYQETKSWRDVYWHLWGLVNYLQCCTCKEYFCCHELSFCKFHPDLPKLQWDSEQEAPEIQPTYQCCQQRALRFDPLELNTGCKIQDHKINERNEQASTVYRDLLMHKELVCKEYNIPNSGRSCIRSSCLQRQGSCCIGGFPAPDLYDQSDLEDDSSEEDSDDDNHLVKDAVESENSDKFILNWKWDTSRSLRYNQDSLREYENHKMKLLLEDITNHNPQLQKQTTTLKFKQAPSSIYTRLEAQWKAKHVLPTPAKNANHINANRFRPFKSCYFPKRPPGVTTAMKAAKLESLRHSTSMANE